MSQLLVALSPMCVPMTVEAAMASASDHRNARCVSSNPRATIIGQTRNVKAEVYMTMCRWIWLGAYLQ